MNEQKLSPWFDMDSPPCRVGVYRAKDADGFGKEFIFSYWNGKVFNGRWSTIENAFVHSCFGKGCDVTHWQGIVK